MNVRTIIERMTATVTRLAQENPGREVEAELTTEPVEIDGQTVQVSLVVRLTPVNETRVERVSGAVSLEVHV